jgi:hypothetical protein
VLAAQDRDARFTSRQECVFRFGEIGQLFADWQVSALLDDLLCSNVGAARAFGLTPDCGEK